MNQSARQGIVILVVLAALIGIGMVSGRYAQKLPSPAQKALGIKTTKVISLRGQDGKTVLELLKEKHQVETTDSEYGVVVTSIDGTKQTDSAIWIYYIDGTPMGESADKATTKTGQSVEYKYENF